MPLPPPRAPASDDPAGVRSWAADMAEAGPAPSGAVPPTAQMPLFHADGLAPPRTGRARLRGRIEALLSAHARRGGEPPAPESASQPGSAWPDSFFDGDAAP